MRPNAHSRARVKLVPLVFVLAGFARRLHRAAGTPCAGVSLVAGLNCKYPTCASRHNHTRRTVWLRHNPLLRRKLFRVFGSMSAPNEGPQAKSLPSPASACATTGLWLKGQSLALRCWWPLHDMHPAWCAGRRFLVARLTGAARSVCWVVSVVLRPKWCRREDFGQGLPTKSGACVPWVHWAAWNAVLGPA